MKWGSEIGDQVRIYGWLVSFTFGLNWGGFGEVEWMGLRVEWMVNWIECGFRCAIGYIPYK